MSEPSQHADLLNALDTMQSVPAYALRRGALRRAERLIVSQESDLASAVAAVRLLREALMSFVRSADLYQMDDDQRYVEIGRTVVEDARNALAATARFAGQEDAA